MASLVGWAQFPGWTGHDVLRHYIRTFNRTTREGWLVYIVWLHMIRHTLLMSVVLRDVGAVSGEPTSVNQVGKLTSF